MNGSSCGQECFQKMAGITGVILAGGASSRMGRNKALLVIDGMPLIEKIYRTLDQLFREVILVTNTPEIYTFLPCRKVADIYTGFGPIGGLHASLTASFSDWIFVTACDTPFINPDVIRMLCSNIGGYDAVVPISTGGKEPMQALYKKNCLKTVEHALEQGDLKILKLLARVQTRFVASEELSFIPGVELSFYNINTPNEYSTISSVLRQ